MAELLQNIVDEFSKLLFGADFDDEEEKKTATYTLTSVFPSENIMNEAEKFL